MLAGFRNVDSRPFLFAGTFSEKEQRLRGPVAAHLLTLRDNGRIVRGIRDAVPAMTNGLPQTWYYNAGHGLFISSLWLRKPTRRSRLPFASCLRRIIPSQFAVFSLSLSLPLSFSVPSTHGSECLIYFQQYLRMLTGAILHHGTGVYGHVRVIPRSAFP